VTKAFERKTILTKIEGTEGVDSNPTVAADAFITRNFAERFLDAEVRQRNIDRQQFGAKPSQLIRRQRGCTFEVELVGSGGAATAVPKWMTLLRPAGFGIPVVGASAVTQAPISAAIPSATQYYYIDDELARTIGARADATFVFEDDQDPIIQMNWSGRTPAAVLAETLAPGAATYTELVPALVSTENTTFTLDGYSPPLQRLEISTGNQLQYRSRVGPQDSVRFRNRAMGGLALIEAPDLAAKDYYVKVLSRATVALQIIHGLGTGNIIQLDAPRVEFGSPTREDGDGDLMIRLPFALLPSAAGNDELLITTK
jgi:hypothetical protein